MEMMAGDTTGKTEGGDSRVPVGVLKANALQRLAGAQERLGARGMSGAFLRAVKMDPVGDMGFLNGLIFSAIVGGPITELLDGMMPHGLYAELSDMFNTLSNPGVLEGVSALRDFQEQRDEQKDLTRRGTAFYPKGRRKCLLEEQRKMRRKFNKASAANQNKRFTLDVQTDLACMFELVDMLGKLEGEGVQEVSVADVQKTVRSALDKAFAPRRMQRGRGLQARIAV